VDYTLVPDRRHETVAVTIRIDEGSPVVVGRLEIVFLDAAMPTGRAPIDPGSLIPYGPGDVFDEAQYDEGRARLLGWARATHFARAAVTKRARVDAASGVADVTYGVILVVFWAGRSGLARRAGVVLREVALPRAPLRPNPARAHLAKPAPAPPLPLGHAARERCRDARGPHHHPRGRGPRRDSRRRGYDTVEQVRGCSPGALRFRRSTPLGFTARASTIRRIAADFLQPHWPALAPAPGVALFEDDEEDTYHAGSPGRMSEWAPLPSLLTYVAGGTRPPDVGDDAVSRALAPAATPACDAVAQPRLTGTPPTIS
jgi:hypothetical protein